MFVCCIVVAAVATFVALVLTISMFGAQRDTGAWKIVILVLSPGWYLGDLYLSHAPYQGWNFTPWPIAMCADFAYYFFLLFGFAIWADRRWRRKRAARIDA